MSKTKSPTFDASIHWDQAQNKVEIDLYANFKRKPTAQELLDAFSELILMHWDSNLEPAPDPEDEIYDA